MARCLNRRKVNDALDTLTGVLGIIAGITFWVVIFLYPHVR